tara:strand:+ start:11638 stop:12315 length:678 start_codon:yes stop_codon:yes gene_type:complete
MVDLNSLLKQNASATTPTLNQGGGGYGGNFAATQGPGSMMGFGGMDNGMGIGGGFPSFMEGIGGNGGGGGGAMSGIMDTINSSYGEMEGAMQGAFDTIKQSLSNNYTSQEVLVPNNGGGGMTNTPPGGVGNAQMPQQLPDLSALENLLGQNQRVPQEQNQGGPRFLPQLGEVPYQGNQNVGLQNNPGGGPAPVDINQDNNQQQISQQQEIDDMFAGMSGQFNGAQ